MQMEGEGKIKSAQEEIEVLKKRIAELESVSAGKEKTEIIKEAIKEHAEEPEKFSQEHRMAPEEITKYTKRIKNMDAEGQDNQQITALMQIAQDKGIFNAVSIAKNLDPHLEDAFHDALINYMQSTHND